MLGTLLLQLCLQVFDRVASRVQLGLLRGRVDLDQQLAFLHRVADLDLDGTDLPGCLGADVNITAWLQGADGGNAALDITPADSDGIQAIMAGWHDLPGTYGQQCRQAN